MTQFRMKSVWKGFVLVLDGLTAYQLVGGVMAHQGDDG